MGWCPYFFVSLYGYEMLYLVRATDVKSGVYARGINVIHWPVSLANDVMCKRSEVCPFFTPFFLVLFPPSDSHFTSFIYYLEQLRSKQLKEKETQVIHEYNRPVTLSPIIYQVRDRGLKSRISQLTRCDTTCNRRKVRGKVPKKEKSSSFDRSPSSSS